MLQAKLSTRRIDEMRDPIEGRHILRVNAEICSVKYPFWYFGLLCQLIFAVVAVEILQFFWWNLMELLFHCHL